MSSIEVKVDLTYHGQVNLGLLVDFSVEVEVAGRTIDITNKLTVDQLNEAKNEYLELCEQQNLANELEETRIDIAREEGLI